MSATHNEMLAKLPLSVRRLIEEKKGHPNSSPLNDPRTKAEGGLTLKGINLRIGRADYKNADPNLDLDFNALQTPTLGLAPEHPILDESLSYTALKNNLHYHHRNKVNGEYLIQPNVGSRLKRKNLADDIIDNLITPHLYVATHFGNEAILDGIYNNNYPKIHYITAYSIYDLVKKEGENLTDQMVNHFKKAPDIHTVVLGFKQFGIDTKADENNEHVRKYFAAKQHLNLIAKAKKSNFPDLATELAAHEVVIRKYFFDKNFKTAQECDDEIFKIVNPYTSYDDTLAQIQTMGIKDQAAIAMAKKVYAEAQYNRILNNSFEINLLTPNKTTEVSELKAQLTARATATALKNKIALNPENYSVNQITNLISTLMKSPDVFVPIKNVQDISQGMTALGLQPDVTIGAANNQDRAKLVISNNRYQHLLNDKFLVFLPEFKKLLLDKRFHDALLEIYKNNFNTPSLSLSDIWTNLAALPINAPINDIADSILPPVLQTPPNQTALRNALGLILTNPQAIDKLRGQARLLLELKRKVANIGEDDFTPQLPVMNSFPILQKIFFSKRFMDAISDHYGSAVPVAAHGAVGAAVLQPIPNNLFSEWQNGLAGIQLTEITVANTKALFAPSFRDETAIATLGQARYLGFMAQLSLKKLPTLNRVFSHPAVQAAFEKYWTANNPAHDDLLDRLINALKLAENQPQALLNAIKSVIGDNKEINDSLLPLLGSNVFAEIQVDRILNESRAESAKGIRPNFAARLEHIIKPPAIPDQPEVPHKIAYFKEFKNPQAVDEFINEFKSTDGSIVKTAFQKLDKPYVEYVLTENKHEATRQEWINKIENKIIRDIFIKDGDRLFAANRKFSPKDIHDLSLSIKTLNEWMRSEVLKVPALANLPNDLAGEINNTFFNGLTSLGSRSQQNPAGPQRTTIQLNDIKDEQKRINHLHAIFPNDPARPASWNDKLKDLLIFKNIKFKDEVTLAIASPLRDFNYTEGNYEKFIAELSKLLPDPSSAKKAISEKNYSILNSIYRLNTVIAPGTSLDNSKKIDTFVERTRKEVLADSENVNVDIKSGEEIALTIKELLKGIETDIDAFLNSDITKAVLEKAKEFFNKKIPELESRRDKLNGLLESLEYARDQGKSISNSQLKNLLKSLNDTEILIARCKEIQSYYSKISEGEIKKAEDLKKHPEKIKVIKVADETKVENIPAGQTRDSVRNNFLQNSLKVTPSVTPSTPTTPVNATSTVSAANPAKETTPILQKDDTIQTNVLHKIEQGQKVAKASWTNELTEKKELHSHLAVADDFIAAKLWEKEIKEQKWLNVIPDPEKVFSEFDKFLPEENGKKKIINKELLLEFLRMMRLKDNSLIKKGEKPTLKEIATYLFEAYKKANRNELHPSPQLLEIALRKVSSSIALYKAKCKDTGEDPTKMHYTLDYAWSSEYALAEKYACAYLLGTKNFKDKFYNNSNRQIHSSVSILDMVKHIEKERDNDNSVLKVIRQFAPKSADELQENQNRLFSRLEKAAQTIEKPQQVSNGLKL